MEGINMDVGALSTMLNESRHANELQADKFQQKPAATVPTQVKNNRNQAITNDSQSTSSETKVEKPTASSNSIWDEQEIPSEDALLAKDERPAPRYEFSYKQSIGTEDTFLGMNDKTPLTSDCTHLVVKVHFPGSTMKQLDLNVTKNRIVVTSRTHRLFTYLPVNVDENNGKAQFDTKKEVLTVTLPIIPEY
jgi:hypothetical protein